MKKQRNYAKKIGVQFFENAMIMKDIITLSEKRKLSYTVEAGHIIVDMGDELYAVWEFFGKGTSQCCFFRHTYNYASKIKDQKVWLLNRI